MHDVHKLRHVAALPARFFALVAAKKRLKIQIFGHNRVKTSQTLSATVRVCLFESNKEPIRGNQRESASTSLIMLLTRVAKWRNMLGAHCSPRICAKGYSHEWWATGEFHNAAKSRSSVAVRTQQLIHSLSSGVKKLGATGFHQEAPRRDGVFI